MKRKGIRVAVLMSGGVDSSLAAELLRRMGFSVVGITLQLWDYDSTGRNPKNERGCCDISNQIDARHVCDQIGVPHHMLDFRKDFMDEVVHPYERTYLSGATPNPCVLCNSKIKWGTVLKKAAFLNFDYIATGHYARIIRGTRSVRLEKARDLSKDQSYALWQVPKDALERTLLPLGNWTKADIRREAEKLNLRTAKKPESQEVCFIDDHYEQHLRDTYKERVAEIGEGAIRFRSEKVLGKHSGFFSYTIGQRKGLRIQDGNGPYYVTDIFPDENLVVVGRDMDLFRPGLLAIQTNWVSFPPPEKPERCSVKIRYNDPGYPAIVFPEKNDRVRIRFTHPQRAVTPGQSAVWYRGKSVWGGGIISRALTE